MIASRVFLIGPRGSGKTTVARVLAGHLGWPWIDADVLLESRAGQSIRDIFAAEGESGFRQREADLLEELCGLESQVIATGGGVVLRGENRERLVRCGHTIWLRGDIDTLWERIVGDATTAGRRPTLSVGGREEVAEIVAAREALYRDCAAHAVDTTGKTPEAIAAEVMALLR